MNNDPNPGEPIKLLRCPHCNSDLADIEFRMFGDGNGNIGMKKKLDEMYNFYSGATLGGKFLRNVLITFATLCTALYVIYRVFTGKNPF